MDTRTSLFASFKFLVVTSLLFVSSCDLFEQDALDQDKQVVFHNKDFYTLPGKSVIIDFTSLVSKSFIDASLVITQNPQRGELIELESLLYKYTPSKLFKEGKDDFLISVKSDGKIIKTETITISLSQSVTDLPCALIAIEDKGKVSAGSSVLINVIANDRICNVDAAELQVSISINPKYGLASVIANSAIRYTPGTAFTGHDELTYKLKDASGEIISYGVLSVTDGQMIQIMQVPPDVSSNIFFVDESNGFVGGNNALYKTIDGGVNWQIVPITGNDEHMQIGNIFFVDTNLGFATYSTSNRPGGGVIRTGDGGTSWTIQKFDQDLVAVYFISSSTGLISTLAYGEDSTRFTKVLLTRNGGSTWEEVFTSLGNANHSPGLTGFHFTELDKTGYFILNEWQNGSMGYNSKIYRTFGGVAYNLVTDGDEITAIDILPGENFYENKIFACSGNQVKMVLDEDSPYKLKWKTITEYTYPVWYIGFSPSGNVGYTVGSSFDLPNPLYGILHINRSVDQGDSWSEEEIEEPIQGVPNSISIPSDHVAYILCTNQGFNPFIVKCSKP